MSIQSSINQAITLGGLLYTQTGGYKAKQEEIAEKAAKTKQAVVAKKAYNVADKALNAAVEPRASSETISLAAETAKDSAEAYKNLFKSNPTEQNLNLAIASKRVANEAQNLVQEHYNIDKAKKANKRAADRVNAMNEQKQSAQRYMMLLKEDKE